MLKYTNINHIVRKQLKISLLEYCFLDMVYHLSNNERRWCYATKKTLREELGISDRKIYQMIDKLLANGLIEKHKELKHIRTTQLWYQIAILHNDVSTAKSADESMQKVQSDTAKSADNNNIYINSNISNKEKNKKEKGKEDLESLSVSIFTNFESLSPEFKLDLLTLVRESGIEPKTFYNYYTNYGVGASRTYKSWKEVVRGWVRNNTNKSKKPEATQDNYTKDENKRIF